MKLSEILPFMKLSKDYEIINDNYFETLGLVASTTDKLMCTFIENEKYISSLPKNVTMVITTKEIFEENKELEDCGVCVTRCPKTLFFRLHNYLKGYYSYARFKTDTVVGKGCKISNMSSISSHNVVIGDNCIIEDFAVIKENTTIGNNVVIKSGCVISREGFEFKHDKEKDEVFHVTHMGGVIIRNNVEIQELTCIDRAIYPWDNTIIGENTKIDCLCQVGHAAKIGNNVMIAGNSTIGGRSNVGDYVTTGGGVTIKHGGLTIGENAFIGIGSTVIKNIKADERVFGNPAAKVY